jgi:hypothetical protein
MVRVSRTLRGQFCLSPLPPPVRTWGRCLAARNSIQYDKRTCLFPSPLFISHIRYLLICFIIHLCCLVCVLPVNFSSFSFILFWMTQQLWREGRDVWRNKGGIPIEYVCSPTWIDRLLNPRPAERPRVWTTSLCKIMSSKFRRLRVGRMFQPLHWRSMVRSSTRVV